MLQLKNITKYYLSGENRVQALNGVSIDFRESEFVSILGQSGCGKTTLLNIVGGLDRYSDGDLIINGKSTKDFVDADWDTYRNHSIGFVFQSYNLIPHQTVLANVELALTLSGVSKEERRRRAVEALEKVGLGNQLHKKPNQMSGGQMQRVAIARSIVNDPDILLADEPTGALDTATSIQIMEILKEIAKDKLVIMVTHNPELAEQYSTRIVRLLDGQIVGDSNPYTPTDEEVAEVRKSAVSKKKHTSMSFFTAFSLSLNNLMTKKGRTAMTVFAGSIGIIGIALILSLSNGINSYIETVQKDTLSSYPITVDRQSMDMMDMMASMMTDNHKDVDTTNRDPDRIYSNNILTNMLKSMSSGFSSNNLQKFKEYVENDPFFEDRAQVSAVQYTYNLNMNIYNADTSGGVIQVNPSRVMSLLMASVGLGTTNDATMSSISSMYGLDVWTEMLDNPELLDSQYELLDESTMHWPRNYDEIVIVVNEYNELSDVSIFALGLRDVSELEQMLKDLAEGKKPEPVEADYSYEDLMNLTYRVVLPPDCYEYDEETGTYIDRSKNEAYMKEQIENGIELKVVGLVRARDGAVSTSIGGTVGYTKGLTEYVIRETNESEMVKKQLANKDVDIFTGLEFDHGQYKNLSEAEKSRLFRTYAETRMTKSEKSKMLISLMSSMDEKEREALLDSLSEEEKKVLMGQDFSTYTDEQLCDYLTLMIKQNPDYLLPIMGTTEFKDFVISQLPENQQAMAGPVIHAMTAEQMLKEWVKQQKPGATEDENLETLHGMFAAMTRENRLFFAAKVSQAEALHKLEHMEGSMEQIALIFQHTLASMDDTAVAALYDAQPPKLVSDMTYEEVLTKLGQVDLDNPASVSIYAASFDAKNEISARIEQYNAEAENGGHKEDMIQYTDYVGVMMSFFTDVINAVSYVLIAFVSISLVVSSIMIGIITYISVLERTKEIGILRAMGASKHDITRVFNAETMIIGLASGIFGILITVLLCLPINAIIRHLSGIPILTASLPWLGGIILVAISVLLTIVAGLMPSLSAAKKDPVIALRTE